MSNNITSSKEKLLNVQRALNELSGAGLSPDGAWGPKSIAAMKAFQQTKGWEPTGYYTATEEPFFTEYTSKRFIKLEDYAKVATALKVPTASIRAVASVESKGFGFLPDGRVTILYERHIFYRYLNQALTTPIIIDIASRVPEVQTALGSATLQALQTGPTTAAQLSSARATVMSALQTAYPGICNQARGGYLGGAKEWPRLEQAAQIYAPVAYQSASYGIFQIMGFNYADAGYKTASEMAEDYSQSEANQLQSLGTFIVKYNGGKLYAALKKQDWASFALQYNGSAYKENKYDLKLATAYNTYSA